ncbi:MAG TPA: crosslink repair DNA glycosylase YcaQ family protein, partial [Devosia sp.]|nr:crosslink repair DNA glycosylase YcaQ family protein [Devosia sp.]
MSTIITDRELNRATLARQMMLERSPMPIAEAVALLLGLQAQTTNGPYQALWNRLDGFTPDALTALIADKTLLRATTLRT